MKKLIYLIPVLIFLVSCRSRNTGNAGDRYLEKIRKQALAEAESYAKTQLNKPARTVTEAGVINLADSSARFLIDPSKIITGDFTGDSLVDAIIPVYLFREQSVDQTVNLFLVNNDGKLMPVRALAEDMKVLSVMKRIIYIDMPVKDSSANNPGCQGCREVRQFTFESDSLRRYSSSTDTVPGRT